MDRLISVMEALLLSFNCLLNDCYVGLSKRNAITFWPQCYKLFSTARPLGGGFIVLSKDPSLSFSKSLKI